MECVARCFPRHLHPYLASLATHRRRRRQSARVPPGSIPDPRPRANQRRPIVDESVEDALRCCRRPRTPQRVGKSTDRLETLRSGLPSDDGLELATMTYTDAVRAGSAQIVTVRTVPTQSRMLVYGVFNGGCRHRRGGRWHRESSSKTLSDCAPCLRRPLNVSVGRAAHSACVATPVARPRSRNHPPLPHPPARRPDRGFVDLVRPDARSSRLRKMRVSRAQHSPDRFVERRRSTDVLRTAGELVAKPLVAAAKYARRARRLGDERLRHNSPGVKRLITGASGCVSKRWLILRVQCAECAPRAGS